MTKKPPGRVCGPGAVVFESTAGKLAHYPFALIYRIDVLIRFRCLPKNASYWGSEKAKLLLLYCLSLSRNASLFAL